MRIFLNTTFIFLIHNLITKIRIIFLNYAFFIKNINIAKTIVLRQSKRKVNVLIIDKHEIKL